MFSRGLSPCSPESGALRADFLALRLRNGDADPGVLLRFAHQRLANAGHRFETKAMMDELADLRADLEFLRLALRLVRLRAEYKANFDPDQPRDDDGRWTDGDGVAPDGTPVDFAADRRRATWPIDLLDEEGDRGGLTIEKHVGKSDDALIRRLEGETYRTPFGIVYLPASGSFHSLQTANKLVNSTLSENSALVSLVANGILNNVAVDKEFSLVTGKEAYRSSSRSEPFIRETYGVRVNRTGFAGGRVA
jgi:hypothetical protein